MEDFLSRDDWAAFSKLGAAASRGLAGGALPRPLYDKLARRGYVSTSPRNSTVVTAQGRTALANWQRSMRT
jgi:ribosomal protein S19E (S16A)